MVRQNTFGAKPSHRSFRPSFSFEAAHEKPAYHRTPLRIDRLRSAAASHGSFKPSPIWQSSEHFHPVFRNQKLMLELC